MFGLFRKMVWMSVAGGLMVGVWTLWRNRHSDDELPTGNWSPLPDAATSAGSTSTAARTAASPRAAAGTPTQSPSPTPASTGRQQAASTTDSTAKTNGAAPTANPLSMDPTPRSPTAAATGVHGSSGDTTSTNPNHAGSAKNAWVAPDEKGSCPADFPIKANDGSKIFHVPGGRSYRRTKAERCYAHPDDATADGYRASKF